MCYLRQSVIDMQEYLQRKRIKEKPIEQIHGEDELHWII